MPRGISPVGKAKRSKPFTGSVQLTPTFVIQGTALVRSLGREMILGDAEIGVLRRMLVAPVATLSRRPILAERQIDGWPRSLDGVQRPEIDDLSMSVPIVLSSRRAWHFENGTTSVYDNALIVDGAKRLQALLELKGADARLAFCTYMGLSPEEELKLRNDLHQHDGKRPESAVRVSSQVGSNTHRLVIGADRETFTIESDPIVVPTAFGYSAAILVRRSPNVLLQHVLIQAKSIAGPLERIRQANGSLIGVRVSVHKASSSRTAEYVVSRVWE